MQIASALFSIKSSAASLRIFFALVLCAAAIPIFADRHAAYVYAQGSSGANYVGDYKRSFSDAGGEVKEKLRIKENNTVKLKSKNQKGKVIHTGVWAVEGNRLVVTLNKKGDEAIQPDKLVFELKGDELIGAEFDKNTYGPDLKFHRAK
jgi:hypothetical protein